MIYLVISFLLVNTTHGYLLFSQRKDSPATISYHSVKSQFTLLLYILTHLSAGVLLALFVVSEFGTMNKGLIAITSIAVLAEWAQALIPAKGKYDKAHTILAGIMATGLVTIVLICTFMTGTSTLVRLTGSLVVGIALLFFSFAKYPPRAGFWKLQFIGQTLLYLQMFLLVY